MSYPPMSPASTADGHMTGHVGAPCRQQPGRRVVNSLAADRPVCLQRPATNRGSNHPWRLAGLGRRSSCSPDALRAAAGGALVGTTRSHSNDNDDWYVGAPCGQQPGIERPEARFRVEPTALLDEVEFKKADNGGFNNECEGHCGVLSQAPAKSQARLRMSRDHLCDLCQPRLMLVNRGDLDVLTFR
jgi:hypothetical protein